MDSRTEWQQWREERNSSLKQPHGWLSLIGLEWLTDAPARLAHFPGVWSAQTPENHRVTAIFTAEDQVTADGEPQVGEISFDLPRGSEDIRLTDSRGRKAEVASRFGRVAVRTRDPQAPTLVGFTQTNTYDFDPEWVIRGAWHAGTGAGTMPVATAQAGQTSELSVVGRAELLGQTVVVTGSPTSANLIFHDATNGETTEGWRVAPAEFSADGHTVSVDFNRAVNFPASFTPFGTCPMPPAANTFDRAITAGEKKNS